MPLTVTITSDGRSQQFTFDGDVTIGRDPASALVLSDPEISRRHARLSVGPGGVTLADLGSGNGTWFGGRELEPRVETPLPEGASFGVGSYTLTVSTAANGATVVASARATPVLSATPGLLEDLAGTVMLRPAFRLHIVNDGASSTVELIRPIVTIGRDPGSDVVIDSPVMSRYHMRLRGGPLGYEVEEVRGQNGVLIDGVEFTGRAVLRNGSRMDISQGRVVLQYSETEPAQQEPEKSIRAPIGGQEELIIGRDETAGLVLGHPAVSRRHARIVTRGGIRAIEDLGSSNGTFVNGIALEPGVPRSLSPTDFIRIGPINLVLSGDEIREQGDSRAIAIDAVGLERRVNDKTNLLQQISLAIRPHEFVAVVGVSGAGKSTLLGALCGLAPATDGAVFLNGMPLYENWSAFRTSLGFVPQDDILHKELTVQRALTYAAALRLPSDTTGAERAHRVDEVIKTLGLQERRDVPVGKLSGGQRKRVSIGAELLTEPGLFFLDEATSGLDPGTESQLMRLLRRLADEGRTIVLVTHATKNVMLCDQVVFLAKGGHLAFFGPPDEALTYFGVQDFDGIYERLDGESTPAAWAAMYRESPQYAALVEGRLAAAAAALARNPEGTKSQRAKGPRPISPFAQLTVLARRYFEIIGRDKVFLAILLLLAPAIGAIDFVATKSNVFNFTTGNTPKAMAFLFLTALFPFMIGALSSVREIVKEAVIYQRERSVALGVAPYLGSKVLVALLIALYHAAALTLIKAVAVDFPGAGLTEFLSLYITIALAVLSGVMFGLVISAITRKEEQAMMLAIGVIIIQIVFSGGLVSLTDLGPAGKVLGGITSTHWAFRGSTTASGLTLDGCSHDSLANCRLPGFGSLEDDGARRLAFDTVDQSWGGIFDTSIAVCWIGMVSIIAALAVVLFVLQKRKDTL